MLILIVLYKSYFRLWNLPVDHANRTTFMDEAAMLNYISI